MTAGTCLVSTVVGTATTKSGLEELISTIPPQGSTTITDGVMTGLGRIQMQAEFDPDAVYQIAFLTHRHRCHDVDHL